MSAHGEPLMTNNAVLALAATPLEDKPAGRAGAPHANSGCAFLYTGHDDGNVKCWRPLPLSGESNSLRSPYTLMWCVAHPGPVTALAMHGDDHIVSASTCRCGALKESFTL